MTIDINELRPAVEAAGLTMQEVLELLGRLEAADAVLKDFGTTAQEVACWLERYKRLEREAEALRAKIAEMEKQKPVGIVHRYGRALNGSAWLGVAWNPEADELPTGTAIYALPGAKGEEK